MEFGKYGAMYQALISKEKLRKQDDICMAYWKLFDRLGAICASKWHWFLNDPLRKMTLCLLKTINGNHTNKYLEKKRRFNLEIQAGEHNNWKFVCNYFCWKEDRILFKAVFQIICSHSMHALQPSDSGKRNTAKSCSQYDKNTFEYAI